MEAGPFPIALLMLLPNCLIISILSSTHAICAGGGGKGRTSTPGKKSYTLDIHRYTQVYAQVYMKLGIHSCICSIHRDAPKLEDGRS